MEKKVSVTYTEQSKSVVVTTKVEKTGSDFDNDEVRKEAEKLYNKAQEFAVAQTMKKIATGK